MLTMDYQDLQYKYSRPKKKKQSQLKDEKYQLTKKNFSASTWKDYKEWVKEQKAKEKLQENLSSQKKKLKCKDTKVKPKKASQKPKKAISRKEQYQEDLKHPLWVKKRDIILKRDNYQCRVCGSKRNLQVHHLKYSNGKRAWEYPNLDLITLCEDCHKKVHSNCKHQLYPKYQEIWYNINGFSDYEATEFGRLRLKDSQKRIQWAHLGTKEHYIDSDGNPRVDDGNETQFTHITNDKGLVVWISKEKLLKLLKSS